MFNNRDVGQRSNYHYVMHAIHKLPKLLNNYWPYDTN